MATQKNYFSTQDSNNIKGGLYQVDTYMDLFKYNAATHFKDGMLCYVSKYDKYYQYYAPKKRWYPVNLQRLPIIDTSINIDGEWFDIARMESFDALLQELVQLKYSHEWQENHQNNMRKYPGVYQKDEDAFQAWYAKCKKAAYEFFYGPFEESEDLAQETDDNIFDYPTLKEILDEMKSDIEYLKLQMYPLNIDMRCDPDGFYIEYLEQDSYEIHLYGVATRNGKEVPIIYNQLTSLWNDEVLWDSSVPLADYTLVINKPHYGEYMFKYTATDHNGQDALTIEKAVMFTMPYYYGACRRFDMNVDNSPTQADYREEIYRLFRTFVESFGTFLYPFNSRDESIKIRELGFEYGHINDFIDEVVNPYFRIEFDMTQEAYYLMHTIKDFLNILADYIIQYRHDAFINGYIAAGFHEHDMDYYTLEGTKEGVKHLSPQTDLTINIPQDGYYIWLCLPYKDRIEIPEVTSNGQTFPLSETYVIKETIYGKNICFRSIGELGMEAHVAHLEIKYNTNNFIEII